MSKENMNENDSLQEDAVSEEPVQTETEEVIEVAVETEEQPEPVKEPEADKSEPVKEKTETEKETAPVKDSKAEAKEKKAREKQEKAEKKKAEKEQKGEPTFAPGAVLRELKKVEWPTFGQLMKSSGLVIVFTLLFGAYFFVCELAASALVSWIVSL